MGQEIVENWEGMPGDDLDEIHYLHSTSYTIPVVYSPLPELTMESSLSMDDGGSLIRARLRLKALRNILSLV